MQSAFALLCVLAFSGITFAQTGQSAWTNLNGLKAGQKIQVIEKNSTKHSGVFLSVSETAIIFQEGAGERSVQKSEVRTVKLRNHRRLRNALTGTGLGAGAGAALGAATAPSDGFIGGKGFAAAFVGTAGAVVGTPIGLLIPTHNTVYSAKQR